MLAGSQAQGLPEGGAGVSGTAETGAGTVPWRGAGLIARAHEKSRVGVREVGVWQRGYPVAGLPQEVSTANSGRREMRASRRGSQRERLGWRRASRP